MARVVTFKKKEVVSNKKNMRLTTKQVEQICMLIRTNIPIIDIAKHYQKSQASIYAIARKREVSRFTIENLLSLLN